MNIKNNVEKQSDSLPMWNLNDLYTGPDCSNLNKDIQSLVANSTHFETIYKSKVAQVATGKDANVTLYNAVKAYEGLQDSLGKISSYADLYHAENTADAARAKFYGDIQDSLTEALRHILFFELELNELDDAILQPLIAQAPLNHYAPWFRDLGLEKPYQLAEQIEQLFLDKSITSNSAWSRLFDETTTSLKFEVDGETLELEETLGRMQSDVPATRKAAAMALSKVFRENMRLFTTITNVLAKDKEISNRWRNYQDVADSRHVSNRVEREVVDALVSSVRAAYPRLSHRYYKLKAKWMGQTSLDFWDRNAPLPNVPTAHLSWNEAKDVVLNAYGAFSPKMADVARVFFDKNWIDAQLRPGKATGAFAHPTVATAHPYVLINYMGKPRDVMTLAHELGHGVHQVLAQGQGTLMASTPLTLAETASVFGEMLTFQSMLRKTTDKAQRKALLASKVEDMINTVVRQIAFYTFEREVHLKRKEGELTAEDINAIWMSVQRESLGDAIRFTPDYETFWVYISHFIHSPFYVYAYAFGDCLVNSLYAVYEKSDEGFVEKYFDMLKAGGSKHHAELLAPFGLDARDPQFWNMGLSLLDRMITELEGL